MIAFFLIAGLYLATVYLVLFIFSVVFSIFSFIFGHDHDVSHDVSTEIGGHDIGAGMPSLFSARVLSLFFLGFSGMGLIATHAWNLGPALSSLCGIGLGLVLGGLAYAFMAMFYREQASSMATSEDYADLEGRVASTIPADGTGEISVVVKGQLKTIFAVSQDGATIPEGRPVKIVSMAGAMATVKPL